MRRHRSANPAVEEKKAKLKTAMEAIANMSKDERDGLLKRLGAVITCEGHPCSITNTILLWHQSETVSVIGGYRQWLAQGRQVRQGEKCLYIFVPREKRDRGDGSESSRNNGVISTELRFATAAVFDISQTEPVEIAVAQQ